MDPVLKRLAEKNKVHRKTLRRERIQHLKLLPFAVAFLALYLGSWYFLIGYDGEVQGTRFLGMSKQVWFFAMILSSGIGALFIASSLAFVVWGTIVAQQLKGSVNALRVNLTSFLFLSASVALLLVGKWLDALIISNNKDIAQFWYFGFEQTPFIVEFILTSVNVIIAMLLVLTFLFIIALPLKARRHAQELLDKHRD